MSDGSTDGPGLLAGNGTAAPAGRGTLSGRMTISDRNRHSRRRLAAARAICPAELALNSYSLSLLSHCVQMLRHPVLLDLPVQSPLADPQHLRGFSSVSAGLLERRLDDRTLDVGHLGPGLDGHHVGRRRL